MHSYQFISKAVPSLAEYNSRMSAALGSTKNSSTGGHVSMKATDRLEAPGKRQPEHKPLGLHEGVEANEAIVRDSKREGGDQRTLRGQSCLPPLLPRLRPLYVMQVLQ